MSTQNAPKFEKKNVTYFLKATASFKPMLCDWEGETVNDVFTYELEDGSHVELVIPVSYVPSQENE